MVAMAEWLAQAAMGPVALAAKVWAGLAGQHPLSELAEVVAKEDRNLETFMESWVVRATFQPKRRAERRSTRLPCWEWASWFPCGSGDASIIATEQFFELRDASRHFDVDDETR